MDYEVAIWLFCSFHTLREKRFKNISIQKHFKKVMQAEWSQYFTPPNQDIYPFMRRRHFIRTFTQLMYDVFTPP